MTNSQPHLRKPTPGQINYLKDLAIGTGQSFAYPQTFGEADAQIKRLKAQKRTPYTERKREKRQVRRDLTERRGDSATVRQSEIDGYGSSATWSAR